jgi:hypothetical protein
VGQASIKREGTGAGLAVDVTGCEGGLVRERGVALSSGRERGKTLARESDKRE